MTSGLDQANALARAFLARFFESEITAGTDDLKVSFFWLLAALAMPGIFIPWLLVFDWNIDAIVHGYEAVRVTSRGEKTFYLGLSMLSAGALATIAWSSLLPDRRDTLVLGALPVRAHVVIAGKLLALGAYIGIVVVAMHAVSAVIWGSGLATKAPMRFMLMGMVAHFVASAGMSMTACLAIAGAQGLALSVVGPRLFARVSTALQICAVGLLAMLFAWLPAITVAVVPTLNGSPRAEPWILSLPPLWFLGVYEWILGTSDPVLVELARRAALAVAVCVGVTALTYAVAYRRLLVAMVEIGSHERSAVVRGAHALLVRAAGRHPAPRAAAEFFTATLARVERQRFVLAIAFGVALAWGLLSLYAYEPSPDPQAALLALPIAAMMFLLAGLRIASSLPADVRAGWVFEVHDLLRRHARQALERVMFVVGVLPPLLVSVPIYWREWGSGVAATHGGVMLALGVAAIQLLIWHCDAMPCGQQWVARRLDFGRRWPIHVALFLIVAIGVPKLEVLLFRSRYGAAAFTTALIVFAWAVRHASATHTIVPTYEEVDPVAGILRIQ